MTKADATNLEDLAQSLRASAWAGMDLEVTFEPDAAMTLANLIEFAGSDIRAAIKALEESDG